MYDALLSYGYYDHINHCTMIRIEFNKSFGIQFQNI
jgi:hypothetical protein